jgi:hypothetical protein
MNESVMRTTHELSRRIVIASYKTPTGAGTPRQTGPICLYPETVQRPAAGDSGRRRRST